MLKNSKTLERFARNFICYNRVDAINRAKKLKEKGIYSTINSVVEHTDSYPLAGSATLALHDLLLTIENNNLSSWTSVSVKMSALGMDFDTDFCEHNILLTTQLADSLGVLVQFDVEGSETHPFYYDMIDKHVLSGALQARSWPFLFEGVHRLPNKPPRIVKGAYKTDIKRSKAELKSIMIQWVKHYVLWHREAIVGTHDRSMINELIVSPCPIEYIELQYLRGVKENDFLRYKELGFKVREYIPYGDDWYPYMMRRIKEDPWGKFKLFLGA